MARSGFSALLVAALLACDSPVAPSPGPAAHQNASAAKQALEDSLRQGYHEALDDALVGTWWQVIGTWESTADSSARWKDTRRTRWIFDAIEGGTGNYVQETYRWEVPEDAPTPDTERIYRSRRYYVRDLYQTYVPPPASASGLQLPSREQGEWKVKDQETLILVTRNEDGSPLLYTVPDNVVAGGVWRQGTELEERFDYFEPER